MAVCSHLNFNYEDYIEEPYKLSRYAESYAPQFQPIPHEDYWIAHPNLPILHPDPTLLRLPGRPRSSRIHNEMDWREPSVQQRCGLCNQLELVWQGQCNEELHCRRREAVFDRTIPLHPLIEPALRASGFYGFARLGFIQLDWHFITALVERWRPETHTFHMPDGECTITLKDVAVQLGLPVDGEPVTGRVDYDWRGTCQALLGVTPGAAHIRGSKLSLPWLASQFCNLADDADEETIARYARAYIMQLIGGSLFADKYNNLVHLMFLPLLADFEVAGRFSWGGACLTWLYRNLCKVCRSDSRDIAGPIILLQVWAWDRFPTMAPQRRHISDHDLVGRPLAARYIDINIVLFFS
ncbi:serine/threonine-protein phosphatase 7 long form homolog [Momordica charantia]|uniref:Serine/threonine-protein phosphatase 7 long form homolog n=1 Tax=Momordica charantia TaxID=3673 RepID=A0A6J1DJK3_MOMCH|nr:serine/threonine-protein phosphatase 7 long form homolog [Momordica charantia]